MNKQLVIIVAVIFIAYLLIESLTPVTTKPVAENIYMTKRGRVWIWINKQADGSYVNQFQQVTPTQAQYYINYIAVKGWDITIEVPPDGLQTDAGAQSVLTLMDYINTTSRGKIPMWLQIELPFAYNSAFSWSSPISAYESLLGTHFRLIDITAPNLMGWGWEEGYDNGVAWLRSATTRPLTQYWVDSNLIPTSSEYLGKQNGIPWRFEQTQAAVVEVYNPYQLNKTVPLIQYIEAYNNSIPIGITTQWDSAPYNDGQYWFNTSNVTIQKQIITTNFNAYTNQAGKHFDFFECIWKHDSPPNDIINFFEELKLWTPTPTPTLIPTTPTVSPTLTPTPTRTASAS